ncbi:MAG: hypothetical protein ABIS50_14895 [Luteolibacter sp.]|uniref:hypothetical protein n=1 Tax=Luteolibacter sp. TaxID=1962973 RepID=UPI003265C6C2
MESVLKFLLILASCLSLAAKEEDGWMEIGGASEVWTDALPVWNQKRAALVLDSPAKTRLRAAFLPAPFSGKKAGLEDRANELLGIFEKQKDAVFTIDWLGEAPSAVGFERAVHVGDGRVRSVSRAGTTSITRTVICSRADDAVFIHLIANQPGALSFKVTLGAEAGGKVKIEDRRQLILTPQEGLASHAWVLPFESDVTPDGDSIVVKGEGEALIVWNYAGQNAPAGAISRTLQQLGERYDPGDVPPNPAKIWQGVLASHLKSIENSP